MGTSHRHKLGVVGQPNWGSVSSSITGLANGVAESDMLDNNPPSNMTSQQKSKRQSISVCELIKTIITLLEIYFGHQEEERKLAMVNLVHLDMLVLLLQAG